MRSLDFREEFGLTQKGSLVRGKSVGGLLAFSPPRKWSKRRKGKGPTINVSNITLVLVPRAHKEWIVDMEESSNSTIKGGKAQAKRGHSETSIQNTKKAPKREPKAFT